MNAKRLLASALALGLLCGCGTDRGIYANYRAVEDLQLVETLGLDLGDGGLILSAAAGRRGDGEAPAVLRAPARDLVQGMEALQDRTVRGQVFFAHTQHLVLGQAYAEAGIGALLDYIERDIHTRMGTSLFVMRGGTADALVTGSGEGWSASDVLSSVRSQTALRGDSHVFCVRETAVALSEYGAALVCALRAVDAGAEPPGVSAVAEGYGILKDGRLVGFLDGGEARAVSALLGVLGCVSLTLPAGDGTVTLDVRCAAPEARLVRGRDGAPVSLELTLRPEAAVAAVDGADPDPAALCAAVDGLLRNSAADAVARAQATEADFLALGRTLRLRGVDPSRLPAHWLRDLPVSVVVETILTRSYDMGPQAGTEGGGS